MSKKIFSLGLLFLAVFGFGSSVFALSANITQINFTSSPQTINLDTKVIKTGENSKVSDNNNLAVYGLFIFACLLGILFLIKSWIKQKRNKNELA